MFAFAHFVPEQSAPVRVVPAPVTVVHYVGQTLFDAPGGGAASVLQIDVQSKAGGLLYPKGGRPEGPDRRGRFPEGRAKSPAPDVEAETRKDACP
jgi:hypothetical protein